MLPVRQSTILCIVPQGGETQMRPALLACLAVFLEFGAVPLAKASDIPSADWYWNVDNRNAVYAGTSNSAENLLAQFCYAESGKCLYAVAFGITCEEGEEYLALINTDKGAHSVDMVCGEALDSGEHLMVLKDFDRVDGLVRSATRIGFVMPMKGDEFKAIRFSLRGAAKALDSMRAAAERIHAQKDESSAVRPAVERL
jgi:hypothetical protein